MQGELQRTAQVEDRVKECGGMKEGRAVILLFLEIAKESKKGRKGHYITESHSGVS